MTDSMFPSRIWPEPVLVSIYKLYPRPENRQKALQRIREALDRICEGEIDGHPRTQEQAIEYLRAKTDEARQSMYGREQRWIPHPTSWYHGRKYLQSQAIAPSELPAQLDSCIRILGQYPGHDEARIRKEVKPFIPALLSISKALEGNDFEMLLATTCGYSVAVETWPVNERRYIPNPVRWFTEQRFLQNPQQWRRTSVGWQDERAQIERVFGATKATAVDRREN